MGGWRGMSTLVYLDTETTGLDPTRHQVWEIAYAVDDGPIRSTLVRHTLDNADADALDIGGYWERATGITNDALKAEFELQALLAGATLVGANPAYDAAMLRARWGRAPWHYRLLDIETYAMPALGLDVPKGLAYIASVLGVKAPDHTAAGDVHVLRECHRKLRGIYCPTHGPARNKR